MKKADKQKQQKAVKDLTFGMKNKKGASTQKQIKGIQNSVKGGMSEQKLKEMEAKKKEDKKKELEEKALMASIFKPVISTSHKKKDDVDPKTIVCQFFKEGLCQKGKKCKYSHDLSIENKAQRIDIYTEQRQQLDAKEGEEGAENEENMDNWDRDKLDNVIKAQENKYKHQVPTEIVCKYFLEAINKGKYGWKWVCPNNGLKCHYRHCLPPGFIMKKDVQKQEEEDKDLLEDRIDEQISQLSYDKKQKVTLEVFLEWKARRDEKKRKLKEDRLREKVKKIRKTGGKNALLTGLAIFMEDPSKFQDGYEDGGVDDIDYRQRNNDDDDNNNEHKQQQQHYEEDDEEEDEQQEEEEKKEEEEKIEQDTKQQKEKHQEQEKKENIKEENKKNQTEQEAKEWDALYDDQSQEKKKKKKKSGDDVKINDDVFLNEEA